MPARPAAAPGPLSAPVAKISDIVEVSSTGIQAIRDEVSSCWLLATAEGEAILSASDDTILHHLQHDRAPMPAAPDRENYCRDSDLQYWIWGLGNAIYLNQVIRARLGRETAHPITFLDFGGSSGRVLRHIALSRPGSWILGCDIDPKSIAFIRGYLPASITAFTNLPYPPLPLSEASVDFVFAGSIFTHIWDYEEAWLLEMRRILRPGGIAFLTARTERSWADFNAKSPTVQVSTKGRHTATGLDYFIPTVTGAFFKRPGFGDRVVLASLDHPYRDTYVMHSRRYIGERWGRILTVEDFLERAHGPHQDGVILRKEMPR